MNPDKKTNIPARFMGLGIEAYDPKLGDEGARREVEEYLEHLADHRDAGRGLLLTGIPGTGKTMLACIVGQAASEKGYSVWYTPFAKYVRSLLREIDLKKAWQSRNDDVDAYAEWRATMDRGRRIRNTYDFVILDDVGKEHTTGSGFAQDEFDYLLRNRYDRGLPSILTTNMRPGEWAAHYSPSMASFVQEAYIDIPVDCKDVRRAVRARVR